jgi:hypothetical protein
LLQVVAWIVSGPQVLGVGAFEQQRGRDSDAEDEQHESAKLR